MRQIPLTRSLLFFLDQLESIEAALSADPDAQVFAPAFQLSINEWDTEFQKERKSRRAVIRSNAVVAVKNQRLDIPTIRLAHLLRGLLPALLQKLFDIAPGRFVRRALRAQAERTITVIVPELKKLPADHAAVPMATDLETRANEAIDALNARVKAKGERAVERNSVDEFKEGINALILSTYGELLQTAAAKGYPRSWADSFFPSFDSDVDADGDDTEAPPAADVQSP